MSSPVPVPQADGSASYSYYRDVLGSPKFVVAPMVDQSELAWRLLCRRHGAHLCYTPMFHAANFVRDKTYRQEVFSTNAEDRPLVVQFCANDVDLLVRAVDLVEGQCDGVDLNLGCPQSIAKRGNYGAFLQDDWLLVESLVRAVHERCRVPISCKVRVFDDVEKTVQYARMIERAGCQLLTVHGRTREQKRGETGLANWSQIAAVKQSVKLPVFANGNIQYTEDVEKCLLATGVDGVMSADGILRNPYLFEGGRAPVCDVAVEYLDLVDQYPCPVSYVRGHLFSLCHRSLETCQDIRDVLGQARVLPEIRRAIEQLRERVANLSAEASTDSVAAIPHWICQPTIAAQAADGATEAAAAEARRQRSDELQEQSQRLGISKRHLRRLQRRAGGPVAAPLDHRPKRQRYTGLCACGNPTGTRCQYALCRVCCKLRCRQQLADCTGHRIFFGERKQNFVKRPAAAEAAVAGNCKVDDE